MIGNDKSYCEYLINPNRERGDFSHKNNDWHIIDKKHVNSIINYGNIDKFKVHCGSEHYLSSILHECGFLNVEYIKKLVDDGATLIITTSRPENYKYLIEKVLNENEILKYKIICDLPHSRRILINDYSTTNPYPSAISFNIERNTKINHINL